MAIKCPATDASEIRLCLRARGKSGSRGCSGRGVLVRAVWIADDLLQAYSLTSVIGFALQNVVLGRDLFFASVRRRGSIRV